MTAENELDALDLSALLCSKVCHDIISPVAAIGNGLEVFEGEDDESMQEFAMELITKAAKQASAKLQFARLAFGAAGSAGAEIDLAEAEKVVRGIVDDDKVELSWSAPIATMAKNRVKLLLNLFTIALSTIPRGGSVSVEVSGEIDAPTFRITSKGVKARIPEPVAAYFGGERPRPADPHEAQPYFASLVGDSCSMRTSFTLEGEEVIMISLSG
jgi:histidine phosphotransferase ChpT